MLYTSITSFKRLHTWLNKYYKGNTVISEKLKVILSYFILLDKFSDFYDDW